MTERDTKATIEQHLWAAIDLMAETLVKPDERIWQHLLVYCPTDTTEQDIESIILSCCHVSIRAKEGHTLPTEDIADIHVGGIQVAAQEIARRLRANGELEK